MPKLEPVVIDLETESISEHERPGSPPPSGLAIMFPGKSPLYLAHDHPTENGAFTLDRKGKVVKAKGYEDVRRAATLLLKDAMKWKGGILGHNIAKFDLPVIEDHYKVAPPAWDKVDDTMFSLFLRDPHALTLSLKPAAEHWLGEAPEERDVVYDWLAEKGVIPKPEAQVLCECHDGWHVQKRTCEGITETRQKYAKDAGAYISKAPGAVVAAYAIGDLTRTKGLHDLHMPYVLEKRMREAYDRERQLAPILLANERVGTRVDMEALERDLPQLEKALKTAEEWIRKRLKVKDKDFWNAKENAFLFNPDSDAHMAQALRAARVVKKFPATPTGKESVSKKNLTIDHFSDKKVYYGIHYRNSLAIVLSQSLRKWFAEGSRKNGYVFREWNQVRQGHGDDEMKTKGARSGRVTVSGFANIAKRIGAKDPTYKHPDFLDVPAPPLARSYILPDKGQLFGHSDFDQQEMKITAHYEDGSLAAAYNADPKMDAHVWVHGMILDACGKDYNRDIVKIVDFRTSYGGGIGGLAEQLKISYEEAAEIIGNWKKALPDVVALDKELKGWFKEGKPLRTLGGRLYYCKPPGVIKNGPRKGQSITYEYTALNYLIQPSAADQTKQAIIDHHNHPKRQARLVNTVYDEINISMPKGREIEELLTLRECMTGAFKLDVPVTTTLKMGGSWSLLEKVKEEDLVIKKRKVA